VQKYGGVGKDTDEKMAHAHCMLVPKNKTHSKFVIIIAYPRQQLLREGA
jgi:hypothetical protein